MIKSIGDGDIYRFSCGVPGCETWQDGHLDDLMAGWMPSVYAGENELFVVCREHELTETDDGWELAEVA